MAENALSNNKVVVIGGSAGSLEVLLNIITAFPEHAGAILIVVLHRKNDKDSILEDLISYKTKLKVKEVEDKQIILPNCIYIAPSDYHLLVENENSFSLDSSEKVHFSRPSIDVTFESVAETFKSRAIGILLSGANADGAAGLFTIKKMGGYTIAQDPATAEVGFMPQQAINMNAVDKIVATDVLPSIIKQQILHK